MRADTVRLYRELTDPPGRLVALTAGRRAKAFGYRMYAARQLEKGRSGLELAALEMLALRTLSPALRASESELRRFPLYLDGLVDRLCCGNSLRSEAELVLEEGVREARENRLTDELLVFGLTSDRLLAAADADEAEAAVLIERARTRRIRARAIERGAA